jgi:hypothetical protein
MGLESMLTRILLTIAFFLLTGSAHAAAPVINYTDIIAGPNSGGESDNGSYLTINGRNFGSSQGSSTVTVGGGEVATYKVWSDTEISVQLGSSAADGDIVVTTSEGSATGPEQFDVTAAGDFFYISTSGTDADGGSATTTCTYASPCRTANYVHALSYFGAGDTLIARGGTFDMSSGNENLGGYSAWINITKIGSVTAPITIMGYPGETATVSWGTLDTTGYIAIRAIYYENEYINLSNLTLDMKDSGGQVIYYGSANVTDGYVENARIVNVTVRGGMAQGLEGVNIISLQCVDNIKVYGLDVGVQSSVASSSMESHIIYLSHQYTNADFGWIYVHDNAYGRAAFQIAGDAANSGYGANSNVKIHHSTFENLPEAAILFNLGSFGPIYFYNNVINNVNTASISGFSAIAIRGAAANTGDYYLYNNTVYTGADGDDGYGGIIQMAYNYEEPNSVTITNNIFYAETALTNYYYIYGDEMPTERLSGSNNLWYNSNDSTPSFDTAPQTTDPKFTTLGSDFTLQSDSPAIENASSTGLTTLFTDDIVNKTRGAEWDIGAYEYEAAAAPTSHASGHWSN